MNSIIKGLVAALLLATGVVANAADVRIFTADNSSGKITGESIQKAFEDAGFHVSNNRNMHPAFKGKFKKTNHDVFRLFNAHHKESVLNLVKVTPRAALFAPFSMSIYTKKGSKKISMASLTKDRVAKVTGIPADNKHLVAYYKKIEDTLAKALPGGSFEKIPYKKFEDKGDLVITFATEMDEGLSKDEIDEERTGIVEELQGSLSTNGFVVAASNKLGDDFNALGFDKYDFFDAFSICKVPVIFEVSRLRPEAGAYAPCTLYIYKEKGSTEVHMAYPSVNNWMGSLALEDKASIDVLRNAESRMKDILTELTE